MEQNTTACLARHSGDWAVELNWFHAAVGQVRMGTWPVLSTDQIIEASLENARYAVTGDGIAVIEIHNQLMKGWSKFGGTNSVMTRRAVRQASQDPSVEGIFLLIDSPGGTVAGTDELAMDVAKAAQSKPLHAHIDDLGASAAYWVASQADRVSATRTSEIGSIGTVATIADRSAEFEKEGIHIHVISTGAFKGLGVPGSPITPDQLEYLQQRVNSHNEHFITSVARGRGRHSSTVRDKWGSGKVWLASEARDMGLIDAVESYDDAITALKRAIRKVRAEKKSVITMAENKAWNSLRKNPVGES